MVVGAGTMGRGIAQVVAASGTRAVLFDVDSGSVDRGLAAVSSNWERNVARGRWTAAEAAAARERLAVASSLDDARDVDLVIEAIVEDVATKAALFRELSALTG